MEEEEEEEEMAGVEVEGMEEGVRGVVRSISGIQVLNISHCSFNFSSQHLYGKLCILSIHPCHPHKSNAKRVSIHQQPTYNIASPNTPMTSANGAATFAPAPACSSGAPVADGDPVLAVRFPAFVVTTPVEYPPGSPDPDATPDGNTALLVTSVLSALSVFVSYAGTLTPAAVVGSSTSLSLSTEEAEGADVALAEPHPGRKSGE
jgi:hypothetical protein